jgi:hypothetical protein
MSLRSKTLASIWQNHGRLSTHNGDGRGKGVAMFGGNPTSNFRRDRRFGTPFSVLDNSIRE